MKMRCILLIRVRMRIGTRVGVRRGGKDVGEVWEMREVGEMGHCRYGRGM